MCITFQLQGIFQQCGYERFIAIMNDCMFLQSVTTLHTPHPVYVIHQDQLIPNTHTEQCPVEHTSSTEAVHSVGLMFDVEKSVVQSVGNISPMCLQSEVSIDTKAYISEPVGSVKYMRSEHNKVSDMSSRYLNKMSSSDCVNIIEFCIAEVSTATTFVMDHPDLI